MTSDKPRVEAYKRYYRDELTRDEARDIIGAENWARVARVASHQLAADGRQPITDDDLREKYRAIYSPNPDDVIKENSTAEEL